MGGWVLDNAPLHFFHCDCLGRFQMNGEEEEGTRQGIGREELRMTDP